jgi:hypothetical protein
VAQWVLDTVELGAGVVVVTEGFAVVVVSLEDEALFDPELHAAAPRTKKAEIEIPAIVFLMA